MIVCNRCNKENQDNYKFCLGCGADLREQPASHAAPAAAHAASGVSGSDYDDEDDDESTATTAIDRAPASPSASAPPVAASHANPVRAAGGTPAHVAAIPPAASSGMRTCPNCGGGVPADFVFCGQCGTRLGAESKSIPPRTLYMNPAVVPAAAPAPRGKLVLIRPDGAEGGVFPLIDGETLVGRGESALFETDTYLSPRHAIFLFRGGQLVVRDAGSLNGVFVKMSGEEEISDGEVFRMGQELLRFDVLRPPQPLDDGTEVMGSPNPGYWGRVSIILGRGQDGAAFPLAGESMTVGRERGDIVFPDDGYVSGSHARLSRRDQRYFLTDLNSSNGSFMRIRGERPLRSSTFLLLGQQLFRVQYT